jgi:hypothetical protein
MEHLFTAIVLGGLAIAQMSASRVKSEQLPGLQFALKSDSALNDVPALPTAPRGNSTILGGQIQSVDPVRDELTLRVFGQRSMKILFDERTEVYLDGKRISLNDLHLDAHASVQTVLDGTNVFALSIHILSRLPEGEYQGRVLSYDPATSELTIEAALSHEPLRLFVPPSTSVVLQGQASLSSAPSGLSDLVKGSLVSVKFESGKEGHGVASQIAILATPGSTFLFSGNLSTVDMHSGSLVLVDPRDDHIYQIFFNSDHLVKSQNLHDGEHIRVTATFDGSRYVASAITAD